MSSKLMGVNAKWFPMMHTDGEGGTPFDEIVEFVRERETVEERGRFHKPVPHSELLTEFRNRANKIGLELIDTKVGLSRDGTKIMCVSNTKEDSAEDYALSVGFRNSTNSTQAFSGAMGTNVWICSNGCMHGLIVPSKQRNTKNNYDKFGNKIDIIFDRFNISKSDIKGQIEMMKNVKMTDEILGRFIKALIKDGSIGNTHICNIIREIDNPTLNKRHDESCFRLLNAGTWVATHEIKNPMQGMAASRIVNNTIMGIINSDFKPLGDDVVDVEVVDVG